MPFTLKGMEIQLLTSSKMNLFKRKKKDSYDKNKEVDNDGGGQNLTSLSREGHVTSIVCPTAATVDPMIVSRKTKPKSSILLAWVSTAGANNRKEKHPRPTPTRHQERTHQNSVGQVLQEQGIHSPTSPPIFRDFTSTIQKSITKQAVQQHHMARLYDLSRLHLDATPLERRLSLNSTTQGTNETPPGPIPIGGRAEPGCKVQRKFARPAHKKKTANVQQQNTEFMEHHRQQGHIERDEKLEMEDQVAVISPNLESILEVFSCFDCFASKSGQVTIEPTGGVGLRRPDSIPREISFSMDSCRDHSILTGDGASGYVLVDTIDEPKRDKATSRRTRLSLKRNNPSILSKLRIYVDKPSVSGTETSSVDESLITSPSIISPPPKITKYAVRI